MNRAEFLKRLGLGVVVAPMVPGIVRESFESDEDLNYKYKETIGYNGGEMISETCEVDPEFIKACEEPEIHRELVRRYSKGANIFEVLAIWRETGTIIF